jgi:hypothetical protein
MSRITRQSVKAMALELGDHCEYNGAEYICVQDGTAFRPVRKMVVRPCKAAIGDDSGDVTLSLTDDVVWLQDHDMFMAQPGAEGWSHIDTSHD